jgi:uncharacterized membrane protein YpjA
MKKGGKVMLRKIGYGAVVWVVPYISAIPLLGLMQTDPIFFKTLMIVIGGITGAVCVSLYFPKVEKDFLKDGIVLGLVWLIVNWLLDFAALLPLSKMPYGQYFAEIGLRYLVMPAMTIPIGYVLSKKIKV